MVLSRNFFLTFAQTIIKIAEIRARGFSDFPFELQLQNEIHEDEGRLLTIIETWAVVVFDNVEAVAGRRGLSYHWEFTSFLFPTNKQKDETKPNVQGLRMAYNNHT